MPPGDSVAQEPGRPRWPRLPTTAMTKLKKTTMKRTSSFCGCCASKPMVVEDEDENEETRFEKFHSVQVRSMH